MSTYTVAVLADSPTGYWRLGESSGATAVDEIGANNATYTGTVTYSVTGALRAESNTAVTLDGSTANIDSPAASAPTGAAARSYEGWIKASSSGGSLQTLFSHGITNTRNWFTCYIQTSNGAILLDFWSGADNSPAISSGYADNHWHHIVVTYDGNVTVKLYVDGSLLYTHTITAALNTTSSAVRWGAFIGTSGGRLTGSLDEVGTYSTALSLTSIAAHYTAGIAGVYRYLLETSTVDGYLLEDGSGYLILDSPASPNAAAEVATGTGAANNASVSLAPNAAVASGTGSASNATVIVAPNATAAPGTGTASTASVSVASNAAASTGTGSAPNAAAKVAPNAGLAAGTGLASNAAATIAVNASAATGTGAAGAAKATIGAGASAATGTGLAGSPTINLALNAAAASGTGVANSAKGSVAPNVGLASGTGAANNSSVSISLTAGSATGIGSTPNAAVSIAPHAGAATGTGAALSPASWIKVNAGLGSGTGTAFNATTSASTNTSANAGAASGTGAANNASVSLAPNASAATGVGAGLNASISLSVHAGTAVGTGVAFSSATIIGAGTSFPRHARAAVTVRRGSVGTVTIGGASQTGGFGFVLGAAIPGAIVLGGVDQVGSVGTPVAAVSVRSQRSAVVSVRRKSGTVSTRSKSLAEVTS